jgi:hypothetical protein
MTQSIPQPEVFAFLLGEGPLEGTHFGDKHPTHQGNFWWRKHLRAALAAQPLVGVIPEGMALVPIEPTPEMLAATDIEDTEYYFHSMEGARAFLAAHYRAMLAAAPQPPAVQQDRVEATAQVAAMVPLTERQIDDFGHVIDSNGSAWPYFHSEKEKRIQLVRRVEDHFGIGPSTQGVDHG